MHTTCTWKPARRHRSPIGGLGRGRARCLHRAPDSSSLDVVLRRVGQGEPMTVAELRHAAWVLARHVAARRMDVAVAQVRVAVKLEVLGA
jgi:hypothetical protein